nr:vegetative cell wall protein gp1-like [Aegilops tauschii subsp. strangulata]
MGDPLRDEPPGRVQPRPDTWLGRQGYKVYLGTREPISSNRAGHVRRPPDRSPPPPATNGGLPHGAPTAPAPPARQARCEPHRSPQRSCRPSPSPPSVSAARRLPRPSDRCLAGAPPISSSAQLHLAPAPRYAPDLRLHAPLRSPRARPQRRPASSARPPVDPRLPSPSSRRLAGVLPRPPRLAGARAGQIWPSWTRSTRTPNQTAPRSRISPSCFVPSRFSEW